MMSVEMKSSSLKKTRIAWAICSSFALAAGVALVVVTARSGHENLAHTRFPLKPAAPARNEGLAGRPWNGGKARSGPLLFADARQKLRVPRDQKGVSWRLSVQIPPDCQSVEARLRSLTDALMIEGAKDYHFDCENLGKSAHPNGMGMAGEELFLSLGDSVSTGDFSIDWTIHKKNGTSLEGNDLIRLEREDPFQELRSPLGAQKSAAPGIDAPREEQGESMVRYRKRKGSF